jgi:hypothetical protein
MPFDKGKVVALDSEGRRVGYQTFEVYPDRKVVLLVQADTGPSASETGADHRAGRAPVEPCWTNSIGAIRSPTG